MMRWHVWVGKWRLLVVATTHAEVIDRWIFRAYLRRMPWICGRMVGVVVHVVGSVGWREAFMCVPRTASHGTALAQHST